MVFEPVEVQRPKFECFGFEILPPKREFDVVGVGEGENVFNQEVNEIRESKANYMDKQDALRKTM